MSIKFIPDDLRQEVSELLDFFERHSIGCNFVLDDSEEDDEEDVIDENYELLVWFPESYSDETYPIGELLDVVYEANRYRVFNEYKFIGKRVALFYIDSQLQELMHVHGIDIPATKEIIDDQEYVIEVVSGLTSYGIKLIMDKKYDDHVPPIDDYDNFIEIRAEDSVDESIAESLIEAYLFELKSTLGISIHLSARLMSGDSHYDELDCNDDTTRLRPLLRGKGVEELLKLYNSSLNTSNTEILVLNYTKVIEYVSQTVIQQDLINSVSKKLFSSRALNPDANYIMELSKVFEGNRTNQKDYFAIKLTIETCCDLYEIREQAPNFLKFTKKLNHDSKDSDKIKAVEEVANAISNTRNMFAHAKTNYEKKGMECPSEQLGDFTKCLDILSQQVIRWFAKEHEDNRVV
ncbi:hypothetical protein LF817_02660 [Halobacillus sp. A1]|uniref:hypothetical protein n=1 Tax=Halobacillus sp. A1 TaxID=2880262 RepID=UPI0020A6D5D8|nr:hypothetical protein [Halobacillus sp. A1]MCP3030238.1 hypothetical protein [Halobacillus sp. A1]